MFTEEEKAFLARITRTMQIIVGAMAAGVVSFFVAVLFITANKAQQPPEMPMLSYMAIAIAPAAILVALLYPGFVRRRERKAIVSGTTASNAVSPSGTPLTYVEQQLMPLVGGYQTALIIRSAILEGAAFFALVTYMIEGQTSSLIAAGMLLLFILAGMPTRGRVEEAVGHERRAIEELRQMGAVDAR
ncbi:MAG: hypothetical protein AB7G28_03160 [Pirellulales bacterium]